MNSRKRPAVDNPLLDPDTGLEWHGERRSTRLGNAPKIAFDEEDRTLLPPPAKRARSSVPPDIPEPSSSTSSPAVVAAPAGKKKSKFWYYTVEVADGEPPIQGGETGSTKVAELPTTNETASVSEDRSSSLSAISTSSESPIDHDVAKGINGTNGSKAKLNGNANGKDVAHPRCLDAPSITAAALIKEDVITGHADAEHSPVFNTILPDSGKPTSRDPDTGSDMSFSDDE